MMLLIEYFNIKSRGKWFENIGKSKTKQIFFGALLGLIPGCLGGYAIVSLYMHNIIGLGSLVAAFIASFGDETFVMLSVMPKKALIIMGILFTLGIIAGLIIEYFFPNIDKGTVFFKKKHFEIHEQDICSDVIKVHVIQNIKNISFQRGILIFGLVSFIIFLIAGIHSHHSEHNHYDNNHFDFFIIEEWLQYTFSILAAISLYIIIKVPEHFLNEHLWGHIIKKHFLKIFGWIFIVIAAINISFTYIDIDNISYDGYYWAFAGAAILLGLIPQSGPHIVFISLFTQGVIPFSILLVSSIVQEGHSALPLLAESKRSFLLVKFIKIIVAIIISLFGYFIGF